MGVSNIFYVQMTIFWVLTSCSHPEYAGDNFFRNAGQTYYSKRQKSPEDDHLSKARIQILSTSRCVTFLLSLCALTFV